MYSRLFAVLIRDNSRYSNKKEAKQKMEKKIKKKLISVASVCLTIIILNIIVSFASETDVMLDKLVEKGYLTSSESQEVRNEMAVVKQKEEEKKKEEEVLKKDKEKLQMKIGGYTQLMYVTDPTLNGKEPLIVKRARISFVKQLNSWASFKVQPDFAGIAGATGGGSVAFREAFIDLVADTDFATFRIGQYHPPFGFETTYSSAKKKVADTPYYMSNVLTHDYDYGVQWWGNLSGSKKDLFSWRIAVMNGTGSATEDNTKKNYVGRIVISPTKKTEFGISAYDRNVYISTEVAHYGGYFKLETNLPCPTFLTLEYVGGKDSTGSKNVLDAIGTLELKPLVGKGILSELAPVVRYEYWDPDTNKTKDEITPFTVGLNFYPDKAVRILADYTIKTETPSKDNNRLNVMLQVNY